MHLFRVLVNYISQVHFPSSAEPFSEAVRLSVTLYSSTIIAATQGIELLLNHGNLILAYFMTSSFPLRSL